MNSLHQEIIELSEALEEALNQQQESVTQYEDEIALLMAQIQQMELQQGSCNIQIEEHLTRIAELERELQAQQGGGVSMGEHMQQMEQYEARIQELQQELDFKTTESERLYGLLDDTERELIEKKQQYNDLFGNHETMSQEVDSLNKRIQELESQLESLQNSQGSGDVTGELMEANESVKEFKVKMMELLSR